MLKIVQTTTCNKDKPAYGHIYNTVPPETLEELLSSVLRKVDWKVEKRGIDEILLFPDDGKMTLFDIMEEHASFAHRITEILDAQPSGQVLIARALAGYPDHPHTDLDPYKVPGYRASIIGREHMNVRDPSKFEGYATEAEITSNPMKVKPEQRFYHASMMYDTLENPGCEEGEKRRIHEWPILDLYLRGVKPKTKKGRLSDEATCPTAPVSPSWDFAHLPAGVPADYRKKYEVEGHRDTYNMDRDVLALFIEHNTLGARWTMYTNAQRWLKIETISPDRESQITFPPKLRAVINRMARAGAIRDVQMSVGRSYLTRTIRQWSWILEDDPDLQVILTSSHGAEWTEQAYARIKNAAGCRLTPWDNFCSCIYGPSTGGEDLADKSFTVAAKIGGDDGLVSTLGAQGLTGDAILRNAYTGELKRNYWKVPVFMRLYFLSCVSEGISMALLDIVGYNKTTTQSQIKQFLDTSSLTDEHLKSMIELHPDVQAKEAPQEDNLGMIVGTREVLSLPRYHTLPIVHSGFSCAESVEKAHDVTLKSLLYRAELVIPNVASASQEDTAIKCRRQNSYITAGVVNGTDRGVGIVFKDGELRLRYRPFILPIAGFRSRERAWIADLDPRELVPMYGDFFEMEWVVYNIQQLAARFATSVDILKKSIDKYIELDKDGKPYADGIYNWSLAFDGPEHFLERTDEGVANAKTFVAGGNYPIGAPSVKGVTYEDKRRHLVYIDQGVPHIEVPERFECMRRNLRLYDNAHEYYYVTNGVQFVVDNPSFAYEERTNAWRGLEPLGGVFPYELFSKGSVLEL